MVEEIPAAVDPNAAVEKLWGRLSWRRNGVDARHGDWMLK